MWLDAWRNWLRKRRAAGPRKAAVRGRGRQQIESLEERFLPGGLTPAGPTTVATSPTQVAFLTSSISITDSVSPDFASSAPEPIVTLSASESSAPEAGLGSTGTPAAEILSASSTTSAQLKSEVQSGKVKGAVKAAKQVAKGAAKPTKPPAAQKPKKGTATSSGGSSTTGPGTVTSTSSNVGPSVGGAAADGGSTTPTPSSNTANNVPAGNGGVSVGASGGAPVVSEGSSSSASAPAPAALVGAPARASGSQLTTDDVRDLLDRASAATASEDAIIVVVDRQGNILGVRTEADVQTVDVEKLVYSIDGAVAEARTAAFFSSNEAPLTSRTVRFISQSTVTEREVEANPSITDMDSPLAGPGFVAPIGLGGHFPPGVAYTPPVDLFAIEHTNRDSTDMDNGGVGRFNADYLPGQEINAPKSYGVQSEVMPDAQPRGIGTLPGGIPLYFDTNGNGVGDQLVGGIGVFFPGETGDATYEQGFVPGDKKTANARSNAPKSLEAEFMALAAIGSSRQAGVKATAIGGVDPVSGIDIPFPRIDLVGITLEAVGPTAGLEGVKQLIAFGTRLGGGAVSGVNQPVLPAATFQGGDAVPTGWLVEAHAGGALTADDVKQIINHGIAEANRVRAAIRSTAANPLGLRTKMVFAVTDLDGEVLGLYRMDDSAYFSLDVAVAKARNMAYYNDPAALKAADQVFTKKGIAFTARTFRFLAEPRFPSGVEGSRPGPFSILNEKNALGQPLFNVKNAENIGVPAPASAFKTVVGYDAFNIGTNFRDDTSLPENQNGVVFFPGSSGVYKGVGAARVLVGGLGVSGDGVDQDDVVTVAAVQGFAPPSALKVDRFTFRGVRLPYTKFLRNPYG